MRKTIISILAFLAILVGNSAAISADYPAVTFRSTREIPTTVAGLGTCNGTASGTIATISDGAASLALGATATGGGSTFYQVVCNGTNWTVSGNSSSISIVDVSGLGNGIATALGVNVGANGSVIVNGGALGTPSSGTLTNATGLPISGMSGKGTGVAAALATTTNTAGGFSVLSSAGGIGLSNANGVVGGVLAKAYEFQMRTPSSVWTGAADAAYSQILIYGNAKNDVGSGRSAFANGMIVDYRHNCSYSACAGDSSFTGGFQAAHIRGGLKNTTYAGNTNRNYVGLTQESYAEVNDTGVSTTLSSDALTGATSIVVASAASIYDGDRLYITLDDGRYFRVAVSGAPVGTTVTIGSAMPSQASSGAVVRDTKGAIFAANNIARLEGAATNFTNVTGSEDNIALYAGASSIIKSGRSIVQQDTDVESGTVIDAGLALSNQTSSPGWRYLIQAHDRNGVFPLKAGGTFIGVDPTATATPTFANFADFNTANITGYFLRFANGSWTGSGALTATTLRASGTTTGTPVAALCLDASGNIIKVVGANCY